MHEIYSAVLKAKWSEIMRKEHKISEEKEQWMPEKWEMYVHATYSTSKMDDKLKIAESCSESCLQKE